MQLFDGLVARQADHVITITTAMKEEIRSRGVPDNKISIAFNSVDPARFTPRAPNKALAGKLGIPSGVPVIGYVGSFVDYEGLDDLITATAGLKQAGLDFRLLLVGDGEAFETIHAQVQSLALDDKVILTGRVPHEEVEDYYSLVDIAPFPRKPWRVCELVSPLKPFEAMALEKVVVVSSTRALKEIVDHDRTGFVFEKGNVDSLRHVLNMLIRYPEKHLNVGKTAREWVARERSWDVAGKVCTSCYAGLNPSA
jgi:glycosyltransferase involved in cell wall biosynthesis